MAGVTLDIAIDSSSAKSLCGGLDLWFGEHDADFSEVAIIGHVNEIKDANSGPEPFGAII